MVSPLGSSGVRTIRLPLPVFRLIDEALLATCSKYVVEPSVANLFAASLSCARMKLGVSFMCMAYVIQYLFRSDVSNPNV